jgi:hypothetical protein
MGLQIKMVSRLSPKVPTVFLMYFLISEDESICTWATTMSF